jgi:hypothetical protein
LGKAKNPNSISHPFSNLIFWVFNPEEYKRTVNEEEVGSVFVLHILNGICK